MAMLPVDYRKRYMMHKLTKKSQGVGLINIFFNEKLKYLAHNTVNNCVKGWVRRAQVVKQQTNLSRD